MKGKHFTTRKKTDVCYSEKWSGVSFAPHCDSGCLCPDCSEPLHLEGHDSHYCPTCDDFKQSKKDCKNN